MRVIAPHVDPRHPLNTQEYAVFTPPVNEMVGMLGDWIEQRQPGGYIYGPSRFGKSRGVKWFVRSILNERFAGEIPVHVWIRIESDRGTANRFWKSWLRALNHRYADKRGSADDMREAVKEFLINSATASGANYVVLIVDEAQEMTLVDWKRLVSLQNELDDKGYRLSVFGVASHQMNYQYDSMARSGSAHVAARFLVAHWRFPGLTSEAELQYVLNGYDEASEWPHGSGVSYLAHWAPDAFARGERLQSCTRMVWSILGASLPEHYKGERAYPMQHVARAIEDVLRRLARGIDWHVATSDEAWAEAIALTRFADHMRLVSTG